MAAIPEPLRAASREPFCAQALIYALLLSSDDEAMRSRQLHCLEGQVSPPSYQLVQKLMTAAQSLATVARLPLVDLSMPALKEFSVEQYAQFRHVIDALIQRRRQGRSV